MHASICYDTGCRLSRRTHLERMYNKVVVGGEHVESVMTSIEACLTGGPGERQLRDDVLKYPWLLIRRRLLDDVVERQCALVRVRVVQVAFRIRKVTTRLQSQIKQPSLSDVMYSVCIRSETRFFFVNLPNSHILETKCKITLDGVASSFLLNCLLIYLLTYLLTYLITSLMSTLASGAVESFNHAPKRLTETRRISAQTFYRQKLQSIGYIFRRRWPLDWLRKASVYCRCKISGIWAESWTRATVRCLRAKVY